MSSSREDIARSHILLSQQPLAAVRPPVLAWRETSTIGPGAIKPRSSTSNRMLAPARKARRGAGPPALGRNARRHHWLVAHKAADAGNPTVSSPAHAAAIDKSAVAGVELGRTASRARMQPVPIATHLWSARLLLTPPLARSVPRRTCGELLMTPRRDGLTAQSPRAENRLMMRRPPIYTAIVRLFGRSVCAARRLCFCASAHAGRARTFLSSPRAPHRRPRATKRVRALLGGAQQWTHHPTKCWR